MRTDLQQVRGGDQVSADLRLLTARRTDLVFDRVRSINRLQATVLEYFPALEAAFDYSKKAPLILVAGYQTPDRRLGSSRLAAGSSAAPAAPHPSRPRPWKLPMPSTRC